MRNETDLRGVLSRIDRRGYKSYRDILGGYLLADLELHVDRVQSDPFASPSHLRVRVERSRSGGSSLASNQVRRVALEDHLARRVREAIQRVGTTRRGSGKSGLLQVDAGGQEVLERTAVVVAEDHVETRLQVGLPAAGRSVLGREATALLCDVIPGVVRESLFAEGFPEDEARAFVDCVENQEALREGLAESGLVAFVAEGSCLPRESGSSDRPLRQQVVPFRAPESLRVELPVPHPLPDGSRTIQGLGVPAGVTLIVGGGYHGKSTLLHALERCVYPHIPGDGREYVVGDRGLVKIRAEDGRHVADVDISPFIGSLPQGRSTHAFCSDDASGSTSQAANIVEAIEVGATGLLLDEDTSATNFMVRDARMQALVAKEREPITPFLDRVRELWEHHGVSTVLVMGGCGDYFEVVDTVIRMDEYVPADTTAEARQVADSHPSGRVAESTEPFEEPTPRIPSAASFDSSRGRRDVKIDAKALDLILFGKDPIDLRGVPQLVDRSQTRAIGHAIHLARERFMNGEATLREILDSIDELFDREGLDILDPFRRGECHPGNYARPRPFEVAAAVNRLRTVRMRQRHGSGR